MFALVTNAGTGAAAAGWAAGTRRAAARVVDAAIIAVIAVGAAACGGRGTDTGAASPTADASAPTRPPDAQPPAPAAAPWAAAPLEEVPPVYLEQWSRAENRATCAPLAFAGDGGLPADAEPVPRAATFGGGWGVAYDLPGLRSAFGVAGAGVEPGPSTYDDWPHRIRWADGSSAGYGPEGGSGPKQLAYLRVAGQRCLYNVWSNIGVAHLERLLGELRFVAAAGPG